VHLEDKANAYSRTLSGGMKRRLLVAKAMVHSPPILVLDEPTAGVDIELRQQLWAYVRSSTRRASRSSSPPIISRKPSSCATGSRSSTTAA
jgi:ABC-type multidrug transport system ATPase subunit